MLSPPTRVLEELEQQEISRSNSKTLSARLPDPKTARPDIRHLGSGIFKTRGLTSADRTDSMDSFSLGSARPGIMHMGSGVIGRIGSSKSRDSSPRKSGIGSALSGESSRERSRSASVNMETYRALNATSRSSRDSYDSKDKEDKASSVLIVGGKNNICADADIVGVARALKYTSKLRTPSPDRSIRDSIRKADADLRMTPTKMGASVSPVRHTTSTQMQHGEIESKGLFGYIKKELSLIPEDATEKQSDKMTYVDSCKTTPVKPVQYEAKKVPSLNMDHLNAASHLPGTRMLPYIHMTCDCLA